MNLEPNLFGSFVSAVFGIITVCSGLLFKLKKLKNEAHINLHQQFRHIQKLYHSLFELEELIEILIEELDDHSLSSHHRQQKNRIKKNMLSNPG